MRHLLGRPLGALAAWATGSAAGLAIGASVGAPFTGLALGGGSGVVLLASLDALRGRRLLRWLQGAQDKSAPRDPGYWGDLGYCVERALRRREQQLAQERDEHTQFLSAIEASPNGVLLLGAEDTITWCNPAAADHLGLDPEGDRLQRVTNLVRAPGFVALLQASEEAALQPRLLSDLRRPGTLSVMLRRYGSDRRLVLTMDVTERERHEAMRRDFVANVSHEIRTPLTALSGFVETMQSLPLDEADRQRVLALMAQQTARMRSLVDDLLTLARLEGSPRPAPDGWFPLDALLERIEARTRSLSGGQHAIKFPDGPGLELAGSEGEIDSALTNLLSNAVRYTPAGGGISVQLQRLGDGRLEVAVRDSGIGIAREHLPRLAERFYRVDGSRSRDTGGTGLGLSIVKHVASRHGGELLIASSPGKGSTFRLLLPAARVRQAQPVPSRCGST